MPFIITTANPTRRIGAQDITPTAVATLAGPDERNAVDVVTDVLLARGAANPPHWPDAIQDQVEALTEDGGTIGPLPDGTVIEVKPISLTELSLVAGMEMTPDLHRALRDGIAAPVIAAFNAREQ